MAELLRGYAPMPGDDYRYLIMVEMPPDLEIKTHEHDHHTLVYYPKDVSRPITIHPTAGTMIWLPIGCKHSIPLGPHRLSVVMSIDDPIKARG